METKTPEWVVTFVGLYFNLTTTVYAETSIEAHDRAEEILADNYSWGDDIPKCSHEVLVERLEK